MKQEEYEKLQDAVKDLSAEVDKLSKLVTTQQDKIDFHQSKIEIFDWAISAPSIMSLIVGGAAVLVTFVVGIIGILKFKPIIESSSENICKKHYEKTILSMIKEPLIIQSLCSSKPELLALKKLVNRCITDLKGENEEDDNGQLLD